MAALAEPQCCAVPRRSATAKQARSESPGQPQPDAGAHWPPPEPPTAAPLRTCRRSGCPPDFHCRNANSARTPPSLYFTISLNFDAAPAAVEYPEDDRLTETPEFRRAVKLTRVVSRKLVA